MKMKGWIGISLLCSIFCFGFALAQPPLRGKFVANDVDNIKYINNPSYLILKNNHRFIYHYEYFVENYLLKGTWEYINYGKIKLNFDPPTGDKVFDPLPTYFINDTIDIVNNNCLILQHRFYKTVERKYIRVPEE